MVSVSLFAQLSRDGTPISETLFTWAAMPDFNVDAAFYFDEITAVMCLIVTGIGTLIHIYSIGYMAHDAGFARYFAYLNLFLFFMLMLVLGKNLVVVFVGWEGVGLASYLLIGFWFNDPAKTAAGVKAFVVNRVGDTGFVLAAFLLYRPRGLFRLPGHQRLFLRARWWRLASPRRLACCCCWASAASRRRSRCMSGCRTRWPAPRRCRR